MQDVKGNSWKIGKEYRKQIAVTAICFSYCCLSSSCCSICILRFICKLLLICLIIRMTVKTLNTL